MIKIEHITKSFGGILAVNDCSFTIEQGAITGLVGPNGAGKTTLFNIIAGLYKPNAGRILLHGQDITGLEPHQLFSLGILRTFQIAHEFATLTVLENLMMVPPNQLGENIINTWFATKKIMAQEHAIRQRAEDVLDFLEISHVMHERAGNLSGGQKKLLELGRTMMSDAKIVFLDEVGAGVNRTLLYGTIASAIERLNKEQGYTFCMIEHDMELIGRLCDTVIVMAEGTKLAQGNIDDIHANDDVIDAYLGRGRSA